MLNWLEQLREKPEPYRRKVLVVSTSVITFVIVLAWLFTQGIAPAAAPAPSEVGTTFFQDFRDRFESIFAPLLERK